MTDKNAIDSAKDDHKKLKAKEKEEILQRVQNALEKAYKSGRKSLWEYVQLGKSLVSARNELKGEFYEVINDQIINKKQVQRYVSLVIDSKSKIDFADQTGNDLEIDARIEDLNEKSFDNMKDPSMTKLLKMKTFSPEDFNMILSGAPEGETKYYETAPAKKYEAPKELPDMEEKEYNEYKNKGTKKLIVELVIAEGRIKTLDERLSKAEGSSRQAEVDREELEETNEGLTEKLARLQKKYDQQKEAVDALKAQNELLKIKNETKEMEAA